MRIGISYDLKTVLKQEYQEQKTFDAQHPPVDDALEEYDSPETLEIIFRALENKGHRIVLLGGGAQFLDNIRREKVDFVFNISEGRGNHRSREAQVPSVLEMLDIPFTGSDPLTLSVCLDKILTKTLVALDDIPTPKWIVVNNEQELAAVNWQGFPFPAIVKPAAEGSSKGIRLTSLAENIAQAKAEVSRLLVGYDQPIMIEEFIDGDEITVGVIGNTPSKLVGMMRIIPRKKEKHFVYSVEVKRDYVNLVDYESPVKLPEKVLEKLEQYSLKSFKVLGCRDFSRVDFRVGRNGVPYFIEINPLPGLGTYSDLIIMGIKMGWTPEGLIGAVLDTAIERYPQCTSA
jgi:D-alanine-D-alanine ligase